ncbi:DNA helicase, ATP-dependent [Thalictrum thalictroides]|uniref:DNA helicase, ATP-dependent n=1 Tax=Thalictrum thalictroides TaxID=46969 RepID=A0A7J6X789_THATH|nr:DNA helicase, ATP-dependent [Thalictrum thalictroides]
MVDAEGHRNSSGKIEGDLKHFASLESEGLSEADVRLYHMLLEMRSKLARTTKIAPYAICEAQTIKKIAIARPSTKAKLSNIDGVNQNFLGRAASIKEGTVFGYILDAAQDGYEINWKRFFEEIGMTQLIFLNIQGAILKVGSRERLKPIKEELPEQVSYSHIKAFLTLQGLGLSSEVFLGPQPLKTEARSETSEPSLGHDCIDLFERNHESNVGETSLNDEKDTPCPDIVPNPRCVISTKQPRTNDGKTSPRKFCRLDVMEEDIVVLQVTKESVLELLRIREGVSLVDIVDHFKGSDEKFVVEFEGEFTIYKKNELYRVL